jgi:anti-sigma B factor antagonist
MAPSKVLTLAGEIDFHLSSEVADSLRAIVASHPARVIVDLAKVTYVDSSGLAALIVAMHNTRRYGGEFLLVGMQESVRPIFETACLDQVFRICSDLDNALTAHSV